MEIGVFDAHAGGERGGVEILIGRNQGERGEAGRGAAALEFQGDRQLRGIVGVNPTVRPPGAT
jgi:hypothetical protein